MDQQDEGLRSKSVPIGDNGWVKVWYEETKSSVKGRSPGIRVGAEINVAIEDLEKAKDLLSETVRDIPMRVRATTPQMEREVKAQPQDESANAGMRGKRPTRMPRSKGRTE